MARKIRGRLLVIAALTLLSTAAPASAMVGGKPGGGGGASWRTIGHDAADTRSTNDHKINAKNVGRLAPRWIATTAGDVSATPVVAHHAVYFPDWGGMLW